MDEAGLTPRERKALAGIETMLSQDRRLEWSLRMMRPAGGPLTRLWAALFHRRWHDPRGQE